MTKAEKQKLIDAHSKKEYVWGCWSGERFCRWCGVYLDDFPHKQNCKWRLRLEQLKRVRSNDEG